MKVVIQIPCFNEAATLPLVFADMPRRLPGVDEIEFLVIDDGSTDTTENVAKRLGVHNLIRVSGRNRRWLGRAFKAGADFALRTNADILVNTDGDNQYPSAAIASLIQPILDERADIVIGDRDPSHFREFSRVKRMLQWLGNAVFRVLTGERVRDGVSGFRAYNRKALLQLNVITKHSYTIDTLLQSYKKGLDVEWIPIQPNPKTRESRLVRSNFEMARRSGWNMLRLLSVYEPARIFLLGSAVFLIPAASLLLRFLYFYLFVPTEAAGHVQSVIAGSALFVIGVSLGVFSVIAGLLSVNRILLEDALNRLKRLETEKALKTELDRGAKRSAG